jgi:molecular chaperone DnaJ
MIKNYYLILGITSDATQEEIRSAYRDKAKRWHPDRSGEGSEPFLAIREAYEVLCDPVRRQAYDQERARQEAERQAAARVVRVEPLRRASSHAEPLVPDQGERRRRGTFVASPPPSLRTESSDHPWGGVNFPVQTGPGRRSEEICVQVSLTGEQARHGGRIRVRIPVRLWCPACQGRGGSGLFACPHCLGSGTVVVEGPVEVTFPGGIVDGFADRVSLVRPGMRNLVLLLHFSVDEQV